MGHRDPRGLAWAGDGDRLWAVERDEHGDELNLIRFGANYGSPLVSGAGRHRLVTAPALQLAAGSGAAGLVSLGHAGPLAGDLVIAAGDEEDLLRVRAVPGEAPSVTARLLDRRYGRIAQVAADAEGALYFITANGAEWGPGRDLLVALLPEPDVPAR